MLVELDLLKAVFSFQPSKVSLFYLGSNISFFERQTGLHGFCTDFYTFHVGLNVNFILIDLIIVGNYEWLVSEHWLNSFYA